MSSNQKMNDHQFAAVARRSLGEHVASQLRTAILRGAYKPGDYLPSERDLAVQFGVDRHTLRSALLELELLGLLERRQGAGCKVIDFREKGSTELLQHLLYLDGEVDLQVAESVIDVGDIIFRSFLELSLKNADANDIALMRERLDDLDEELRTEDIASVVAAHRAFVRTLCRSGHSVAIELLLNTYVRVFDATLDPEHNIQRRWASEVLPPIGSSAYRSLVNAIERRDHDGARQALGGALLQLRTLMMGIIAPGHRPARPGAASQTSTRKQRKPR
jgi:GntR family transcriptional regulator, transcriptional repressor for pyruvate dehydrogenase complex